MTGHLTAKDFSIACDMIAGRDDHIKALMREITAYQIAKDNLELRVRDWMYESRGNYYGAPPEPAQVY